MIMEHSINNYLLFNITFLPYKINLIVCDKKKVQNLFVNSLFLADLGPQRNSLYCNEKYFEVFRMLDGGKPFSSL